MHRFMVSGTSARAKETEMDVQKLVVSDKIIRWCETFGTLWFNKTDIVRYFKKTQPRIEWMIGKLPGYLSAKLKVRTHELWFVELDGLELLFRLNHIRDDDPFVMAVKEMTGTDSESGDSPLDDSSLDDAAFDDITDEQKEVAKMDGIINIHGVQCYEKDGVAYLSLEAVARGLGFTQTQVKNGVEYESIRWERIENYLAGLGYPHKWGKGDFIPENVFYRLAMKAKNETAERFQTLVADEIIPTIRKTGGYVNDESAFVESYFGDSDPKTKQLLLDSLRQIRLEKEKNKELALRNDMLAEENSKWSDRTIINTLVPAIAGKVRSYPALVYGEVYREVLKKYHIDLVKRRDNYLGKGRKSLLEFATDEELQDVLRVVATMAHDCGVDFRSSLSEINAVRAENLVA